MNKINDAGFTVEGDHIASMPASPQTFWPWR